MLLRAGAAHVVAVDVGYGQIAWSLRTDERVTVVERVNIRELTPEHVGEPPSLVVADLSFISLRLVLAPIQRCVAPDADYAMMVKPQFEVGKDRVGAGGVVRDPALRAERRTRRGRPRHDAGPRRTRGDGQPAARPVGQRRILPMAAGRFAAARRSRPGQGRGGRAPMTDKRSVLIVTHTGRPGAVRSAQLVLSRLNEAGISARVLDSEAEDLSCAGVDVMPVSGAAAEGAEMVIVLGGDGTLLRAADLARAAGTPLLGVNLGHVGLPGRGGARPTWPPPSTRWPRASYDVEERMTVDVVVRQNGGVTHSGWALNEASVEKASRQRMLEVVAEIDGRPLSRWGCDGVVCATPTGSTAYAFSAGGPVVWPEVEALLVVPISAHALFARPLVVSPHSVVALELLAETSGGVLWCDGRRQIELPPGARVEVRRGARPVRLARLHQTPFTDRLVTKFGLPVAGWRGRVRD